MTVAITGIPHGRLTEIRYTQVMGVIQGQRQPMHSVRIEFQAPDGDYYTHDFPNGRYDYDHPGLQFMAKWGYQPSDIPVDPWPARDCRGDQKLVPLVYDEEHDHWFLHELAMKGAEEALKDVEWFAPVEDPQQPDGGSDDAGGGSDDSDGGGQVTAEMEDEESDRGVTMVVE